MPPPKSWARGSGQGWVIVVRMRPSCSCKFDGSLQVWTLKPLRNSAHHLFPTLT